MRVTLSIRVQQLVSLQIKFHLCWLTAASRVQHGIKAKPEVFIKRKVPDITKTPLCLAVNGQKWAPLTPIHFGFLSQSFTVLSRINRHGIFFIWHNDNWGKQWTDSLWDCEKFQSVFGPESLCHLRTLTLNKHWQVEFLRWLRCKMQKYVISTHTYITYKNVLLYKQGHDSYIVQSKFNVSDLSWLTKTSLL